MRIKYTITTVAQPLFQLSAPPGATLHFPGYKMELHIVPPSFIQQRQLDRKENHNHLP